MRTARRQGIIAGAINAVIRTVVDFAPDPHTLGRDIAGEAAWRLQGGSGLAYIGDVGDPARSWNGPLPTNQVFVGASVMGHNPIVSRDQSGADIATGVTAEGPFADTTRRIFAQRLARRSAM